MRSRSLFALLGRLALVVLISCYPGLAPRLMAASGDSDCCCAPLVSVAPAGCCGKVQPAPSLPTCNAPCCQADELPLPVPVPNTAIRATILRSDLAGEPNPAQPTWLTTQVPGTESVCLQLAAPPDRGRRRYLRLCVLLI